MVACVELPRRAEEGEAWPRVESCIAKAVARIWSPSFSRVLCHNKERPFVR